jgi:hypothetical protein
MCDSTAWCVKTATDIDQLLQIAFQDAAVSQGQALELFRNFEQRRISAENDESRGRTSAGRNEGSLAKMSD